jgi:serine/threonine protein kinase
MTPERWKRIDELCHAALERPEQQRAAFIAQECAGDDELREEVEELVSRGGSLARGVLDRSSWEARADPVVQWAPGTRLGLYEVIGPIGAGGMGQVFQARDTRLGRDVAIKVAQGRFSDRFAREARAVASLNHPNICTLHDVGPDYLVMELIQGPTLDDRIREGAFPLGEALAVARQIAAALEAAHEKGIVHRDLKSANVKFSTDGTVKVLDFGPGKVRLTIGGRADVA